MRTRLLAILALTWLSAHPARAAEPDGFRVVVHASNKAAQALTRAQVSQLFLKKTTRWADGKRVLPVEPADLAVREKFARKIHGKSVVAVKSFWNQQIFSGREVPPIEKSSDAEVIAYVKANPEAIGYVASGADLAGVAAITPKD
jgi:ABC-type phosphate transport system substrate-binding protein